VDCFVIDVFAGVGLFVQIRTMLVDVSEFWLDFWVRCWWWIVGV